MMLLHICNRNGFYEKYEGLIWLSEFYDVLIEGKKWIYSIVIKIGPKMSLNSGGKNLGMKIERRGLSRETDEFNFTFFGWNSVRDNYEFCADDFRWKWFRVCSYPFQTAKFQNSNENPTFVLSTLVIFIIRRLWCFFNIH